jgi:hypothetical protein
MFFDWGAVRKARTALKRRRLRTVVYFNSYLEVAEVDVRPSVLKGISNRKFGCWSQQSGKNTLIKIKKDSSELQWEYKPSLVQYRL